MNDRAYLHVTHMDDSNTEIQLGVPGAVTWLPTPAGLMVKRDWRGQRTVFPWATVKSYTVLPRDRPHRDEGYLGAPNHAEYANQGDL